MTKRNKGVFLLMIFVFVQSWIFSFERIGPNDKYKFSKLTVISIQVQCISGITCYWNSSGEPVYRQINSRAIYPNFITHI